MTNSSNETGMTKLMLVLVLAGLVLYGSSVSHPFHFDDQLILSDNNVVTPAQWRHFLNPIHLRQLTFFTFYLNHLVASDHPAGYHMVNVALHIANAVLLLVLLLRWVDRRIAWVAAAIFLVHPIQTEAVLYVYQRSLLLACFFSLLALLAYDSKRPWLSLLLFICAFESKESALAVPLLLGIFVWSDHPGLRPPLLYQEGKSSLRFSDEGSLRVSPPDTGGGAASSRPGWSLTHNAFSFAVLILVVILAVGTIWLLKYHGERTVGLLAGDSIPPFSYLLTESRVIYTYFRLLVFPFPQSLEYDFATIHSINFAVVLQIIGLLVAIGAGIVLARSDKWRIPGLAILAFFILLAPTSSIIPSTDAAFEHRLYLPMLAFSVLAAAVMLLLPRTNVWIAGVLILASVSTWNRGKVWASDVTLWEDAVRNAPNKPRAWFNLAGACLEKDPERARHAYERTIELKPDYFEAYYNLGVIEQSKGNYAEAIHQYERTTVINKDYWPAWNNLGNSLVALGDSDRALNAFETTLRLNPDHWPSQYNIAIVHFKAGRFSLAIPRLRTVLDWRPDFRDARYLLAVSLTQTGQPTEANREWQKLGNNTGQPPLPVTIPAPVR